MYPTTIGYCTPVVNDRFFNHIINRIAADYDVQIIRKICNKENGRGITKAYNEIIAESVNNTIILCHNDIEFLSTVDVIAVIHSIFALLRDVAIIGVIGGDSISAEIPIWGGYKNQFGQIVQGYKNTGKADSHISFAQSRDSVANQALTVDGLFMAVRKDRLRAGFDENIKTFHFYDICFCVDNYLAGCKTCVTGLIPIRHDSTGGMDGAWRETANYFREKYKKFLPIEI